MSSNANGKFKSLSVKGTASIKFSRSSLSGNRCFDISPRNPWSKTVSISLKFCIKDSSSRVRDIDILSTRRWTMAISLIESIFQFNFSRILCVLTVSFASFKMFLLFSSAKCPFRLEIKKLVCIMWSSLSNLSDNFLCSYTVCTPNRTLAICPAQAKSAALVNLSLPFLLFLLFPPLANFILFLLLIFPVFTLFRILLASSCVKISSLAAKLVICMVRWLCNCPMVPSRSLR